MDKQCLKQSQPPFQLPISPSKSNTEAKCLNLACGDDYREGWVNLDLSRPCDVMCDINQTPWPFQLESFDMVLASHILEHLPDLRPIKIELARVLKEAGMLAVIVPHYTSPDAWGDDTHCRAFSKHSFWPCYWPGFAVLQIDFMDSKNKRPPLEEDLTRWVFAKMQRNSEPIRSVKAYFEKNPSVKGGIGSAK